MFNVPQWTSGQFLFQTDSRKWLFRTLFLDSRFQNYLDNSAHMSSLNLTPKFTFETRFWMFIINGYCTKNKRLQSFDSLLFFHEKYILRKCFYDHFYGKIYDQAKNKPICILILLNKRKIGRNLHNLHVQYPLEKN